VRPGAEPEGAADSHWPEEGRPAFRQNDPGEDAWDALVAGSPEGTLFHTRAWVRIVTASFPRIRDVSVRREEPPGPAILPLFAWSRLGGAIRTLQSSFPFIYGGALPAHAAAAALPGLLESPGGRLASWRISGNPFAPADPAVDRALTERGFVRGEDSTWLLELPAREEDYWEKTLTAAKRNDVRRLGRKGVVVEESRRPEDVDGVYRHYLASFARWGGRPRFVYPVRFYRNLLQLGGPAVRLTVARHEGRLLGGAFTLRWNGKAHYLAGYFDHESRALRPNVLIQIDSILQGIRDGLRWYDFLPSGGHASVVEFKEGLGGRRAPFPVWTRTGPLHRMLGGRREPRRTLPPPPAAP